MDKTFGMKITLYQIDAFTDTVFSGNPAAVCVLKNWLDEGTMQQIAAENNLAETAFVVKNGPHYEIRWFTPEVEVDLCGHATLASAYVLFDHHRIDSKIIDFYSPKSGNLRVEKGDDDYLIMDFPSDEPTPVDPLPELAIALGKNPEHTLKGKTDYLLIFANQKEIEEIRPNFFELGKVDARGIIVSAKGDVVDFVSRFFAPRSGINEDPVTGSAHTSLAPYWSKVLGKTKLRAKQLSKRQGDIICEHLGKRVNLTGKAVLYMVGEIDL